MSYQPKPLDTSKIVLTDELKELTELLAKNTHDVWAQQRMDQGWTQGPHRDDTLKHHPSLVAYEDLSEQEKDYDRSTSLETLKAIVGLGFTIAKQE
jgi:ryanodine receptor 2